MPWLNLALGFLSYIVAPSPVVSEPEPVPVPRVFHVEHVKTFDERMAEGMKDYNRVIQNMGAK